MTSSELGTGGHSGNLGLMSCVRESSPQECLVQPSPEDNPNRNETSKKRRFHPFRGLRKIFRKKLRYSSEEIESIAPEVVSTSVQESSSEAQSAIRGSRSTSELLSEDDSPNTSVSNIYPGLSISHDSVFTGEKFPSNTNLDSGITQSSSSLSIQAAQQHTNIKLELANVLRQRRDKNSKVGLGTDEEDLGLPSSICDSPTAVHQTSHKTKSHSTCSDGSLLSIGSSEIDEGSYHHSFESKFNTSDEFGVDVYGNFPLNHNAAKHKMAVKPKRTHGAPRRKRNQLANSGNLPVTLEEDVFHEKIINFSSEPNIIEEPNEPGFQKYPPKSEKTSKSASLPPGLTLPGKNILSRSCSNASKKDESDGKTEKEKEKSCKKESEGFFGRFLIRRSNKKLAKKSKTEDQTNSSAFQKDKSKNENKFKTSISVDQIDSKKVSEDHITSLKINPKLHNLTISIDTTENPEINKMEEYISLTDQEIELKNTVEKQKEIFEKSKPHNLISAENSPIEKSENQYLFDQKIIISNDDKKMSNSKSIKKMKSDDYFMLNSTKILVTEDRKNSIDSSLKNLEPRSGPASRQRVLPIDLPASPDLKCQKSEMSSETSTEMSFGVSKREMSNEMSEGSTSKEMSSVMSKSLTSKEMSKSIMSNRELSKDSHMTKSMEHSKFGSETSKFGSETPKFGSETSKFGSETSKFAETSKFGSETSKFGSETSKFTETSKFGSETSKFGSETSKLGSETSKFTETSKFGSETSKFGSETSKFTETSKFGSETSKFGSETSKFAETSKFGSETSKFGSETSKFGLETSKFGLETSKFGSETSKFAETSKFGSETSKFGSETSKFGLETSKFGSETSKFGSETSKFGSETSKFVATSKFGSEASKFAETSKYETSKLSDTSKFCTEVSKFPPDSSKYKSLPMLSFNDFLSTDLHQTSTSAPCNHQIFHFKPDLNGSKPQNWPFDKRDNALSYKSKSYDETETDFKSLSNFEEISKPYVPKSYSFRSKLSAKNQIETTNVVVNLRRSPNEISEVPKSPKDKNTTVISINEANEKSSSRKSSSSENDQNVPEFLKIQLNRVTKDKDKNNVILTLDDKKDSTPNVNVNVKCQKENVKSQENDNAKKNDNVKIFENVKNLENVKSQSVKTQTVTVENVKRENVKMGNVKEGTGNVTVKNVENVKQANGSVSVKNVENVKTVVETVKTQNFNEKITVKIENPTKNIKQTKSPIKPQVETKPLQLQTVKTQIPFIKTEKPQTQNVTPELIPYSMSKTSSSSSITEISKMPTPTEKNQNRNSKSDDELSSSSPDGVVLRRKNSAFKKENKKDSKDEPELMKVFARRSLKLKDSEAESLSQHVIVLVENSQNSENLDNMNKVNLKKSCDKENDNDNENENEPILIKNDSVSKKKIDILNKFERSSTFEINQKNSDDSSRKVKSFCPKLIDNNNLLKKTDVTLNTKSQNDVINNSIKNGDGNLKNQSNDEAKLGNDNVNVNENEKTKNESESEFSSMFKRISQRKEEWEQRAQQALNKKTP